MHYPNLIRSLGLLATACTVVPVFAQTTWTGATSGVWNVGTNWSNGVISGTNAAVFDSTSTANLGALSLSGGISTAGITVTSPASDISLSMGGHVLTIGAGGITLDGSKNLTLTRGSTGQAAFVALSATQTWAVSSGRTLALTTNGEYDIVTSGVALTMNGGGAVNITSSNFDIGQTNANSLLVDGVTLTTSSGIRLGQGNATGVGSLTISSGSVNVGTLVQFGSGTGASGSLIVQGGSTLGTTQIRSVSGAGASSATFDGATLRVTAAPALGNLIDQNGGNFTTSLGDSGLNVDTNSINSTISVVMGNKAGEVGVLTKSGAGSLTLTAANTFTGLTTVDAGSLVIGADGSLASTAYSVASGAVMDVSAKASYSLAGVGLTLGAGAGSNGFFNAGSAALTFGGGLTVNFTTLTPDASYNLLDFGAQSGDFSSVALTGTFNGGLVLSAADTWTGSFGGYDWTFSETTGVLSSASVIPEPSAFAALAGAGALFSVVLRRRRRA
jgi:fibronectin-binding autotransporter adhesin